MFSGLDSIGWGSMQHAYGPATEVPALLRALVSDDPAAREHGLDGMYGAVHHQGDVYECTVAAIPFLLEAAAVSGLPGRGGVLELLASIGGADWDDLSRASGLPAYQAAHHAVGAACPLFARLLSDPDPEVRRAAPQALQACRDDARQAVAVLRARLLEEEADAEARAAVISAVGAFGRRAAAGQIAGIGSAEIGAWLADIAGHSGTDPGTRLAAIAELARCAPAMLPPGISEMITDLLRTIYAAAAPAAPPAGFSTSTLAGALRELSEGEAAARTAPAAAELVRAASAAFGDRVEDRVELLTRLLREEGWEARHDALRPAKVLIEGWRGSYEEIVFLVGEQLLDPHPRLAAVAAGVLEHLDAEAAPAADALARSLDAAPREAPHTRNGGLPPWVVAWNRGVPTTSPVLRALAALQDPRALPGVQWALERPDMPGDIGHVAGQFGPAAAGLVPLARRRRSGPAHSRGLRSAALRPRIHAGSHR